MLGAVLGKPIGISAAVWLSQKVGIAFDAHRRSLAPADLRCCAGRHRLHGGDLHRQQFLRLELLVGEAKLAVLLAALALARGAREHRSHFAVLPMATLT
ncbi:MAG: hypothetical protein R2705_06340 [Ilumatobacteraceae bacterium]